MRTCLCDVLILEGLVYGSREDNSVSLTFISIPDPIHTGTLRADLKNPDDSTVHSPFSKRQAFTPSSAMMEVFLQEKPPTVATSTAAPPPPSSPLPSKSTSAPQMSPGSSDNQSSSPQPAQQKLKQHSHLYSLTNCFVFQIREGLSCQ